MAQIIVFNNFDNFTTGELRSAYIALKNDDKLDIVKVRRKLYAELIKLVNKGWLYKKKNDRQGLIRYCKTSFLDREILYKNIPKIAQKRETTTTLKQKTFEEKLNIYKAELLLNIGEIEAYKEIYSELPDLVDEIQPLYNVARDKNSKILGKIKAIEGLLNNKVQKEEI